MVRLDEVREKLRLVSYQTRVENLLASNRQALTRLHNSQAMFSFHGAKAAQELLLAHQHLLKASLWLNRTSHRPKERGKANFEELEGLLETVRKLTYRTGSYLTRLRNE